jgi:hypothetical protein
MNSIRTTPIARKCAKWYHLMDQRGRSLFRTAFRLHRRVRLRQGLILPDLQPAESNLPLTTKPTGDSALY